MATPLESNLYPPVIATYMPAFIRQNDCVVYFSLSSYNQRKDINGAQISLRYQNSDLSALQDSKNKKLDDNELLSFGDNEIYSYNTEQESLYAITIPVENIKGGAFGSSVIYKLQIRFQSRQFSGITSEWSTVCLILGIDRPQVFIRGLDSSTGYISNNSLMEVPQSLDLVGEMYFSTSKVEKEYLSQWRARFYDNETQTLVYDTDEIYTNTFANPNEINKKIPYNFILGKKYYIIIDFLTNNGYSFSKQYNILIAKNNLSEIKASFEIKKDIELGGLSFIVKDVKEKYIGNITIRRSAATSNFTIWDDIYTDYVEFYPNEDFSWTYTDLTAESGIFYKYQIQKRAVNGGRGNLAPAAMDPSVVFYDDVFLTDKNKSLKITFNHNVSSIGYMVSENKTETIGSQYPYIRRNGDIKYREFSISGTISYLSDIYDYENIDNILEKDSLVREDLRPGQTKNFFYDREKEIGKELEEKYREYNYQNNITPTMDYIYEKLFREKVMEFLYDGKPKIYRSATEGNMIVKLTGISFTPNGSLGNLIYDFSATATEICEPTFENFVLYDLVQEVSDIDKNKKITVSRKEQVIQIKFEDYLFESSIDFYQLLKDKISFIQDNENYYNLNSIKAFRIIFNSAPKPILITKDGMIVSEKRTDETLDGYILQLNENQIFVNKEGIYQLNPSVDNLNKIKILSQDADVIFDCCCIIDMEPKTITTNITNYSAKKIGQFKKMFTYREDIIRDIQEKYNFNYGSVNQSVNKVFGLKIEANESTVIELTNNKIKENFIISDTELLTFIDENNDITSCKICGYQLYETDNEIPKNNEFKLIEMDVEDDKSFNFMMIQNANDRTLFISKNTKNFEYIMPGTVVDDSTSNFIMERGITKRDLFIKDEESPLDDKVNDLYSLILKQDLPRIYLDGNWYPVKVFIDEQGKKVAYVEATVPATVDYCFYLKGKEYDK